MGKAVQILIAGKQRSLRVALKGFLQTYPGYQVVGAVEYKEELFDRVNEGSALLLLLDEDFADPLVEEVILPLRQLDVCPKLLILGSRPELAQDYLDAGAAAFTSKSDPPKSLLTEIESIRLNYSHE